MKKDDYSVLGNALIITTVNLRKEEKKNCLKNVKWCLDF